MADIDGVAVDFPLDPSSTCTPSQDDDPTDPDHTFACLPDLLPPSHAFPESPFFAEYHQLTSALSTPSHQALLLPSSPRFDALPPQLLHDHANTTTTTTTATTASTATTTIPPFDVCALLPYINDSQRHSSSSSSSSSPPEEDTDNPPTVFPDTPSLLAILHSDPSPFPQQPTPDFSHDHDHNYHSTVTVSSLHSPLPVHHLEDPQALILPSHLFQQHPSAPYSPSSVHNSSPLPTHPQSILTFFPDPPTPALSMSPSVRPPTTHQPDPPVSPHQNSMSPISHPSEPSNHSTPSLHSSPVHLPTAPPKKGRKPALARNKQPAASQPKQPNLPSQGKYQRKGNKGQPTRALHQHTTSVPHPVEDTADFSFLDSLPPHIPVMAPADPSAVEQCRKAAEDFANAQVSLKKRKAGDLETAPTDVDDPAKDSPSKKQRGVTEGDESEDAAEEERPEDISHRKYQKRLQKNRNSAFVSRIRRREYTRILEEKLEEKEKHSNMLARAYNELRHKLDVVTTELTALKESTATRAADIARSVARPVGEVASSAAASSTAVVTMFMFAIMFGMLLPDLSQSTNFSGSHYGASLGNSARTAKEMVEPLHFPSTGGFVSTHQQPKHNRNVHHHSMSCKSEDCPEPPGVSSPLSVLHPLSEATTSENDESPRTADELPSGEEQNSSVFGKLEDGRRTRGKVWGSFSFVDEDDLGSWSEPNSGCPTMVDMDGDPALDSEPATKQRLMCQLEKNTSLLFGREKGTQVMRLVERKMLDGVVTTQVLAVITKKTAAASPAGSSTESNDAGSDVVGMLKGEMPTLKTEPVEVVSAITTGSISKPYTDGKEDSASTDDVVVFPQSFSSWLHRLSIVADDRFAAEISAFIAFHLIPYESNGNGKTI